MNREREKGSGFFPTHNPAIDVQANGCDEASVPCDHSNANSLKQSDSSALIKDKRT